MTREPATRKTLLPAHMAGFAAFLLAGGVWFVRTELAALPLALFVTVCLTASFLPRVGFFLKVISRGARERREVALTFDDGPDPGTTPGLLELLGQNRVAATFFVVGTKAEQEPDLVREILRRGHTIGNHSYRHDPWLMLRSRARLADEIGRAQTSLESFGIRPLVFRPPVGITNPKLGEVLEALKMVCVNFSCRAGDFGNRRIRGVARTILKRVRPGAIILLHDVSPPAKGRIADWLREVEAVIDGLRERGYGIVPLSQLIDGPVMEVGPVRPVRDFT